MWQALAGWAAPRGAVLLPQLRLRRGGVARRPLPSVHFAGARQLWRAAGPALGRQRVSEALISLLRQGCWGRVLSWLARFRAVECLQQAATG